MKTKAEIAWLKKCEKKKTFKLGTDKEGVVDVELVEGCGMNERGFSLRINGICVAHVHGYLNGYAKLDVYPKAGRIAGLNWIDIYEEGNEH